MNEIDMCHVMIDMETYGTNSTAVIRSIAGVLFNLEGKTKNIFNTGVDVEDALMEGLVIDQSTVNFWRDQPNINRTTLMNMPKLRLREALGIIKEAAIEVSSGELDKLYMWSHGSNFDIVILENAYKVVGEKAWWKYSNVRDTRTLFDIVNFTYKSKGVHDALTDAVNQAVAV